MALQSVSVIDLDMSRPGVVTAHAKQYDTARKVEAHLYADGVKWFVPSSNTVAVIGYKKSIRNGGFYDTTEDGITAVSVNGSDRSIVTILLDRPITAAARTVLVELSFYDTTNGHRLSSFSFKLKVEAASVSEMDLSDDPRYILLGKQLKAILDIMGPRAVVAVDSSEGVVQFSTVRVRPAE